MPESVMSIFVSHSHQDDASCHRLVKALRAAGANVWYDEHNLDSGRLMDVIDRELRQRPVFVVMLSPAALTSSWVKDECSWAYRLARQDPDRLILPVLVGPLDERDIWVWLQDFKRIEAPGGQSFPEDERIRRTLRALALTPKGERPAVAVPQPTENLKEVLATGRALSNQKKHAEALPYFERAALLDPQQFDPWMNLGYTLRQLKRWERAVAAYKQAVAIDSNRANAWTGVSLALLGLKKKEQYEQALAAAIRGTELEEGSYAYAWNAMGNALRGLGRNEEALRAFEAAIARDGTNTVFKANKALTLRALGRES